jgi:hypothetical protein
MNCPCRLHVSPRRCVACSASTVAPPIRASAEHRGANRFRPTLERCEDRATPSVTGRAFYDRNDNGSQDAGEPGAPGLTAWLHQGSYSTSTPTDSNGDYAFPDMPGPGDYVEVMPSYSHFAYSGTSADASSGTADIALVGQGNEAGGQGTIRGQLWFDTNGAGAKDAGETSGPSGFSLDLIYGGTTIDSTTTDPSGDYSFGGLWSGSGYSIHVGMMPGYELLVPGDTSASASVASSPLPPPVNIGVKLPVVTVEKDYDGLEGGMGAQLIFTRTGDTSDSLTVYFTPGGTATSGDDYSALGYSVTFQAGYDTAALSVIVNDDSDSELTEIVTVTIDSGGNDYRVGSPGGASLNILDNDGPVVAVTVADTFEGAATGGFTFTRTGDLSGSLAVGYTVTGTATSGTDYTALSGTLTFAAGEDRVEVPVEAFGDNVSDDGETVTATIDDGGDDYTIDGVDYSATVIIGDQPLTVSVNQGQRRPGRLDAGEREVPVHPLGRPVGRVDGLLHGERHGDQRYGLHGAVGFGDLR